MIQEGFQNEGLYHFSKPFLTQSKTKKDIESGSLVKPLTKGSTQICLHKWSSSDNTPAMSI